MKITEVTKKTEAAEIVKALISQKPETYQKDLEAAKNQWDVNEHQVITNKTLLKDKEIRDAAGNVTSKKTVNRIAVPYQKMIVERAVAFGFANGVKINHNADGAAQAETVAAVERVLFENKDTALNRSIARDLYRGREVAEIWYFQAADQHEDYGFKANFRLRCLPISPWNKNTLHPIFNEYNDLIAFAREFSITENGNKLQAVTAWTDEEEITYVKRAGVWMIEEKKNPLGKIPVVYASQENTEWQDVQNDIERLEVLFSRHAEINDYHSSPKTFIKGTVRSMPQAGEANPVLNGDQDSDVKVISWQNSQDSIKLEIETRLENIHKFTQTPDISFKSVKALNQISGVMLKMLFMDAHLKVMAKNEIWDAYFTRRYSIIKAALNYLKSSNPKDASNATLEMTPVIKPFMINDLETDVKTLLAANGGLPIMAWETSVRAFGQTDDAAEEYALIVQEQAAQANADMSQPTSL